MVIGPAHTKAQGVNESCSSFEGFLVHKFKAIADLSWFVSDLSVSVLFAYLYVKFQPSSVR